MKLIIDGYGKSITKKNNLLVIKERDEEIYRINIKNVSDITITGKGSITYDALSLIAKYNVVVISVNFYGQVVYIINSPSRRDIKLRKRQYFASEDERGIYLARELIKSKMKNQMATIRTLNRQKGIVEIKQKENRIDHAIDELDMLNSHLDNIKSQIMGIEGKSSAEYWSAVSLLLPEDVNFKNRDQRPVNDVVNSMLNYGYAILASQITRSLLLNNLDPYCGFLHSDRDGRTSLTYDIIEEFRQQIVDKVVFKLVNTCQITENDVDRRNNSLKLESRKLLATNIMDKLYYEISYDGQKLTYLDIINNQINDLTLFLLNGKKFEGFYLRW